MQTITKELAMELKHGDYIFSKLYSDSRGNPVRARVNGKCKTWKTRPEEFRLPMKHGLKSCFNITHDDAHEWETN